MIYIDTIQDLKQNKEYIVNQINLELEDVVNDYPHVTLKKVMSKMVDYVNGCRVADEYDWDVDNFIVNCIDDLKASLPEMEVVHTDEMHKEGARKQLPSSMR